MEQRATGEAHGQAAAAGAVAGATVEFDTEVVMLLVAALRGAVKFESAAVGSENLLVALVMGDSDAGAAIAPGMRKAGGIGGLVSGRGGRGWASADEVDTADADRVDAEGAGLGEDAGESYEITAAWREARWRFGLGSRRSAEVSGRELPGMTGALRKCLLLALKAARAEGSISAGCRHVARALLELPDSRAREALVVERLDLNAAAGALDTLDANAAAEAKGSESFGVTLLRRAGTLGKSGNRLTRALTWWTSGSGEYGSPVLFAVSVEAGRQAVRCGRAVAEPVDLVLGILALDRALAIAGQSLPEELADVNTAAALLRRHGARQDSMVRSASATTVAETTDAVLLSESAEQAKAVALLTAAEQGSATVGTVHLLAALLDQTQTQTSTQPQIPTPTEPRTPTPTRTETAAGAKTADPADTVVGLLTAGDVDIAALRADLPRRPGA
ncbi:hypothetical protein ACIQAC_29920 [Streptomyces sp. NPDC088387]|uniref:hypothetical protein n=1 Tax=Streptomyces sp. NPDC088387 TaxID=3365859 RepID=UPI0038073068